MKTSISFLAYYLLFSITTIFAQGPGQALDPNPPDSSFEISVFLNDISWANPPGTISNDVWIGIHPDYLTNIYSGAAISSFQISSPIEYRRTYFWRVDAIDQTGTTEGEVWLYTSTDLIVPTFDFFIDSFSAGTGNWIITNDGGDCVWNTIDLNNTTYDMPVTASKNVLAADGLMCGAGTSTYTTATLLNPVVFSQSTQVFVLWDNDWRTTDSTDTAYAELSNDFGNSWFTFWQRPGVNARKTQEFVEITSFSQNDSMLFRFRTIQNGSNSWWAIDNFFVYGEGILSPPFPPSNLVAIGYTNPTIDSVWVELNWIPGGGAATGQRIKRKLGDQYSQYMYFIIAEVGLLSNFFIDSNVDNDKYYTYKIGIFEGPFEGSFSNEAAVLTPPIPVELTSFTALVRGTDVHLKWSTATELNNYGFKILRRVYPAVGGTQNDNEGWNEIGFVPGNGTTTERQSYIFIDEFVPSGKYQYRLKQIDYDGSFEYSDIEEVEVKSSNQFSLEQNYPNPFNPVTKIKYQLPTESEVKIIIYNSLGEITEKITDERKGGGYHEIVWNAKGKASGVYLLVFEALIGDNSKAFRSTKKLLLIK